MQLALDDVRWVPSPATRRIPGLANDLTGHRERIVDRAGKFPERPAERSGRMPQLGELRIWALDNVEDYLSLSAAVRTERRVCRGDLAGKKLRVASGARRRGRRVFGRESKPTSTSVQCVRGSDNGVSQCWGDPRLPTSLGSTGSVPLMTS